MDEKALQVARELASRFVEQAGGDLIDGNTLVRATLAGYLAASGVPTDEAVARVTQMVVKNLVGPVPPNPMYHGLPWMIAGPVSGAPYYR